MLSKKKMIKSTNLVFELLLKVNCHFIKKSFSGVYVLDDEHDHGHSRMFGNFQKYYKGSSWLNFCLPKYNYDTCLLLKTFLNMKCC